jgi:hypothetical protein
MKFRVGVVTLKGNIMAENFETRPEIDDYLLKIDETEGLKCYRIVDGTTKEVIEKWSKT